MADPPTTHSNVKLIATAALMSGDGVAYVHFDKSPDSEAGWFLPNDLLKNLEGPYAAARRIAKEQAGVDVKDLHLVDVDSFVGNDGTWHIAFHFRGDIANRALAKAGQGIPRMQWFSVNALPPESQVAHKGWYNGIVQRAHQQKTGK